MIYDLDRPVRRRRTASRTAAPQRRLDAWGTALILGAIVLVAVAFRTINLANWDGQQGLHPDERFVAMAVNNLRLPGSVGEYFDSATSPLNPRNYEGSRMWVYGTLPATITRVATDLVHRVAPNTALVVVGRALSAVFDVIACVALFFLGRRIYDRRVGLLAAALYAVTVMPIQQAHFFTMDNFGVAFATLALLAAVRLAAEGRWRDAIWAGLFTGAAVASKINLAPLAAIVGIATLQIALRHVGFAMPERRAPRLMFFGRRWIRPGLLLMVAGLVTFVSFRVFQPDAFTGPNLWNIWPDPRFLQDVRTVRGLVDGTVDFPPSHQWASRTPYLFAL